MDTKLWKLEDVAAFLGMKPTQARKATAQPDFPPRVMLWEGAHPRWVNDDVVQWKAARERAGKPILDENDCYTALYRHFNAEGRLLYVGVSLRALTRLANHRIDAPWYRQIARVELEWFDTRSEALAAEADAIIKERPRHNVQSGTRKAA